MRNKLIIAALAVVWLAQNAAALSPADRCEADKLTRAGKYNFCRMKAEAKAVKQGTAPDYTLCDLKLGPRWTSAEATARRTMPNQWRSGSDLRAHRGPQR
jgi:hypothetical protein